MIAVVYLRSQEAVKEKWTCTPETEKEGGTLGN